MSKSKKFRLLSFFILVVLTLSLTSAVFAETTAPAASNGTTPISSTDGPLGTSPETTIKPSDTAPGTTKAPESSSMLDPNLTTTPDTADTMPDKDNAMDGDNKGDDGFNYTGLIIALAIAAAVILLVILLVPKNKNKR